MRRVIGFVACTSLLTATLWWVDLGETAETTPSREALAGTNGSPSPRESLRLGKEHYLSGRFAEAVVALEAAAAGEAELSAADRKQLHDYLPRSRANRDEEAQAPIVARGQSGDPRSTDGETPSGAAAPRTDAAKKLISEARRKFNAGQAAEAEKLALEGQKLGVRTKMFGDSPEKLLEDIQEQREQDAKWKKDNSSAQAKRNRSNYLLKRARQLAEEGDVAHAEKHVRDAEQIKVQRTLTDLKPEQIRQLLARKPAAPRSPSGLVQADASAPAKGKKALVRHVQANEDALDLDDDVSLPKDETPASKSAPKRASKPEAKAVAKSQKSAVSKPAPSAAKQAQDLLQQAELDLKEGRLDEAKEKAQRAQKLDVVYDDVLARDPEFVLAQIERAERNGNTLLAKKPAAKTDASTAVASKRKAAAALTDEAAADVEAGRLEEAKVKTAQAEELDVAFDLMDETPERVNTLIEQEEDKRYIAKSRATRPQAPVEEDVAPELPSEELAQVHETPAEVDAGMADLNVVRPSGLPAAELFERGKEAMRARNTQAAYRFFLEAYQSGERLDDRKMQTIRDFLARHAPAASKKIQLAGTGPTEDNLIEEPAEQGSPRRIDVVDEHRQVALDKLRQEVKNATFRAERIAETNPKGALELIDKAQLSVENSGLDNDSARQLLTALAQSRSNVDYAAKINEPRLETSRRKKEIESSIRNEEAVKVKVDNEFAEKVQKFNELMDQKRFPEAEILAKQARQLQPENPVSEAMYYKAKLAAQNWFNQKNREAKADVFTKFLNDVDDAAATYTADITYPDAKKWKELVDRRQKYKRPDNRTRTKEEERIERSLSREVSLHFENATLSDVIKHLATVAEVNIVLDPAGLDDAGLVPSSLVSINVDGIRMKSALNLLLEPLHLAYTIRDEVLKVTSKIKQQGELSTVTYSVADLVVPIQSFAPPNSYGMTSSGGLASVGSSGYGNRGQMNVGSTGGLPRPAGQSFFQVDDNEGMGRSAAPRSKGNGSNWGEFGGGGNMADFTELIELITSTVQPESWDEVGGPGSVREFRTTLSMVIRQTQAVHDEIADLLGQLRRLQDLQVTIEVRFVTVSDQFFERIGIDFDFRLHDNVGDGSLPQAFGQPLAPFGRGVSVSGTAGTTGTTGTTGAGGTGGTTGAGGTGGTGGTTGAGGTGGATGTGGTTGGTTGTTGTTGTAGTSGGGVAPFTSTVPRQLINQNSYPRYGSIVGLLPNNTIPGDLDIPFQQGSFPIGVPKFGGFQPDAGLQVGLAILSDIETFFLINAAQGDTRNNLLFAPKVTLFNGQQAFVQNTAQRPFVTSLIPTVGFFSVGFQPQITVLNEGVTLSVLAVISADRRYVRLSLSPSFTSITDVQTFSFVSGGGGAGGAGGQVGQAGGQVGQAGGQAGGVSGGGGFGGAGGNFGVGGIGGGIGGAGGGGIGGATGGVGGAGAGQAGTTGAGGQAGQAGGQAGAAAGTNITVQQPVFEIVNISTTVSVPDGGTVLLGGIKRLREGRTMAGVPILNKIPYISRLFKNTGVGRETESLMMMVTPRIIIQEEEEELLGVEQ